MSTLPIRPLLPFGAQVDLHACGPRPADDTWDCYADLDRWSSWAPQIRDVRTSTDARRLSPGLTGQVQGPGPLAVSFQVLDVDEQARTWTWQAQLGPIRLHLQHGVGVGPDEGSSTWLRIRGPAPVVLAYAPVARLALTRLVNGGDRGDR